ncbi:hypothetical protein STVIR_6782 [Streptomyces viridochromogenes Tue57]|uniref:Uncharacterized protein n=1 Tax=Streptomyces viridochromogenes Tue57 TaxID=1160705 RepID=L8P802_STRVR|nr:hypothetical protein STVIR_6782 [Streptomyces viridochromogenes Tue57]
MVAGWLPGMRWSVSVPGKRFRASAGAQTSGSPAAREDERHVRRPRPAARFAGCERSGQVIPTCRPHNVRVTAFSLVRQAGRGIEQKWSADGGPCRSRPARRYRPRPASRPAAGPLRPALQLALFRRDLVRSTQPAGRSRPGVEDMKAPAGPDRLFVGFYKSRSGRGR